MAIDVTVDGLDTTINVTLDTEEDISIDLDEAEVSAMSLTQPQDIDVDMGEFVYIDREEYGGLYTVTPTDAEQTLDTSDKAMRSDVRVLAIPYFETTNIKGTTVYIGGSN